MRISDWSSDVCSSDLARRADRRHVQLHMRLLRRAAALLEVAGRAGRRDIFPGRPPAGAARNDMVEGQVVRGAAILAGELVAQEQVEPGEGEIGRAHV